LAALLAVVLIAAGAGERVAAQTSAPQTLRQQVERRFDVVTVQDGLVLKPKSPIRDVRWVEVTGGTITVNGAPVSGAELRDKVGDDADVVMQLSYVDPAARAAMFRDAGSGPTVEPSPPDRTTSREKRSADGGQFKMGGSITVPAGEIVAGDVVNVGGAIHVFGEVRGDVVAIGGTVELGPAANVGGDVTVIGGSLQRDPAARVSGEVVDVGSMASWRARFPRARWRETWGGRTLGSVFSLLSTLARVAVLCLLAALVVLLGRDHVMRISARAAAEPLKAGAIGLLAQLLLLPLLIVTIVLLVVTIIGIPLLVLIPFVLLGLVVVALVGFTSVACHVGHLLNARFGRVGEGPYATTIAGILILVSPLLLARLVGLAGGVVFPMTIGLLVIGTILEYVAWTIGFGAVALVRFNRPGPATLSAPTPEGPGLTAG
jgi:Flp pilus assembly pilin Flp